MLNEDSEQVALGFVDVLETTLAHISRQPASGSPRYAHKSSRPDLRFWPVPRFPNLIFYVEGADYIDVWRVLHGQRDIPAWMPDPDVV